MRRWLIVAAGAVLLVVLPWLTPGWTELLVIVEIFLLVVLGLDVLTGQAGQVSLGQTLFMAVGGYGAGLLTVRAGWPTWLAVLVPSLASAALAALLGWAFLRLRGYYLALATLGLAVVTQASATGLGKVTGGPSGLVGVPSLTLGGWQVFSDTANYLVLLVLCVLGAWFTTNLRRGQTGRALAAVEHDPQAAAMLGINPARYRTGAFVVAAVFASVAGSLYAYYLRFISPDLVSVTVALSIVVMLALGGPRTVVGPLLGVLLLQGLPLVGQAFALWQPLVAGLVLVLVLTYLPAGLWGGLRGLLAKARAS
ncbi:MAG: branched-chain amino acid ABC transporter permease [Pseudonocardia sp.]|nr:branched-chain amino acid ABC transporter permease [Pseudonocardia sp.]